VNIMVRYGTAESRAINLWGKAEGDKLVAERRISFLTDLLPLIPPAVAGASCLPVIYDLNRLGRFLDAFWVIALMGALGGIPVVLSKRRSKPRLLHLASAFVAGAFASEFCAFAWYFITFGYSDPELVLGVLGDAVELGGIASVGSTALCIRASVGLHVRRLWRMKTGHGERERT
jgi:hypothetical protein